jgi:3-oxoacyl-[acyl-carrier-protein] synthase-3
MALSESLNVEIAGLVSCLPSNNGEEQARCSEGQTASDLCFSAAENLFQSTKIDRAEIGAIIYLGASPDYRSPATSCVLHGRLVLDINCLAFDFNNSGCGFTFALQFGSSLLAGQNKPYTLLMIGDSPSKWLGASQRSNLKIQDGGTALLLAKGVGEIKTAINTYSDYSDLIKLQEGGFRVSETKEKVDFLYSSASKYGTARIDQVKLGELGSSLLRKAFEGFLSKSKLDLDSVRSIVPSYYTTYFGGDFISNNLTEGKLQIRPRLNFLGSSIPLTLIEAKGELVRLEQDAKLLSIELGEGLTIGIAEFNISKTAYLNEILSSESYHLEGAIDHEM